MKVLVFSKDGEPLDFPGGWPDPEQMWPHHNKFYFPEECYIRARSGQWYRSDLTPWIPDQLPAVIKTWLLIL